MPKDSEPFFQLTHQPVDTSPTVKRTGPDSHAAMQLLAGKLKPYKDSHVQASTERTGPDVYASKHQSAGKLKSESHRPEVSTAGCTGPDMAALQHQSAGKPHSDLHRPGSLSSNSDPAPSKHQSTSKLVTDRPQTDRPRSAYPSGSDSPPLRQAKRRDNISSLESQAECDLSDRPLVELFVEEGELSDDQDFVEQEQPTSEEQTYRETMSGIRSFMGWTHVPDMDVQTHWMTTLLLVPRLLFQTKCRCKCQLLCKKLSKLNLTLVEGYPSRSAEAGSLPMNQFLKPARPQTKWYGLYPGTQSDSGSITSWNTGPSKLNSSFGRISRKAGVASIPPASRWISQDTLRRWEKSTREASVICNQAASFNRCLFKVQQEMQTQLKLVRGESKGKGSSKASEATDELQFLMNFNGSITQAAAKAMEHLTEFVFITMGNITLACCDAYLTHLKNGVKPDTLAALRTGPLQIATLFPDSVIKKAEEEIAYDDTKGQSSSSYTCGKGRYHPYERVDKKSEGRSDRKQERPAWKSIGRRQFRRGRGKSTNFSSRPAEGQQSYK